MNTQEKQQLLDYLMLPADNVLILGQRLGEWCGHGPVLEQDIAMTNIALDLIGEARNYYQYAAEIAADGRTEDDFPYKRDVRQFRNILLVELPNGHWGDTLMRQFMFDCFHYYYLEALKSSNDKRLAAIASKSFKEVSYHIRFSGEWIIRLGDGTDESHQKIQTSLDNLMPYFEEMFIPSDIETQMKDSGIAPDLSKIKIHATDRFENTIEEATLIIPQNIYPQKGGKTGLHTEHLGFIISDLQYLQRAYPGAEW
ncbi:MAG: phenylacetate-CoA oxygenase subunit PaaC [Saprospiraceae bacterium]|nr:phenylacetate-CoA oxygenase subunit PaaC [Saprospiraceae bacterium]